MWLLHNMQKYNLISLNIDVLHKPCENIQEGVIKKIVSLQEALGIKQVGEVTIILDKCYNKDTNIFLQLHCKL